MWIRIFDIVISLILGFAGSFLILCFATGVFAL